MAKVITNLLSDERGGTKADFVQKSLFSDVRDIPLNGLEEFDKVVKAREKRKRGCYNKIAKLVVLDPVFKLNSLMEQIALYTQLDPFFTEEKIYILYDSLKVWQMLHIAEPYEYEGEIYEGEFIRYQEAELMGTENLLLHNRIKLHEQFLTLLKSDNTIELALLKIQPIIKEVQKDEESKSKKYTLGGDKKRIFAGMHT